MISREFRLVSSRCKSSSVLANRDCIGSDCARSLISTPAVNAQRPKANDLVKITSAKIDPPLAPVAPSTLKVAAEVIPGWQYQFEKPFSEDYIPTKARAEGARERSGRGPIKYPPAETMTSRSRAATSCRARWHIKLKCRLRRVRIFRPSLATR